MGRSDSVVDRGAIHYTVVHYTYTGHSVSLVGFTGGRFT